MRRVSHGNIIALDPVKDIEDNMRDFHYDKGNCFLYDQCRFPKKI